MQMDPEVNTNNNKESNNYIARKYLVMKKNYLYVIYLRNCNENRYR